MKCINVYLTVASLLLSMQSIAQKNNSQPDHHPFKRLYIGDQVPMDSIILNNVRNYPGGKAKLSNFKGKYIILDFWTKACGSCIASFPRMEELQQKFKDDIQILLVTKNTEDELKLLMKNSFNLKNTKLPVVIGDQILTTQLFPHGTVPYHVWLDREGKVIATTESGETNQDNLGDLIAQKRVNLINRNEILDKDLILEVRDWKSSLLKVGGGIFQKHLKYYAQILSGSDSNKTLSIPRLPDYSLFMNYVPGDIAVGRFGLENNILRDENKKAKGFKIVNLTIEQFYRSAYLDRSNWIAKIIMEGESKSFYEKQTYLTTNASLFKVKNSYCYESFFQEFDFETAKKILQQDLARFFGMVGSIEYRMVKHVVITKLNNGLERKLWAKKQSIAFDDKNGFKSLTDSSFKIKNHLLLGFISMMSLANKGEADPIIVDDFTRLEKEREIEMYLECGLNASPKNITILRNELAKYGLGLREEMRNVKVLVLKSVL